MRMPLNAETAAWTLTRLPTKCKCTFVGCLHNVETKSRKPRESRIMTLCSTLRTTALEDAWVLGNALYLR